MAPMWTVGVVFATATGWLYILSSNLPTLEIEEHTHTGSDQSLNLSKIPNRTDVSFPTNLEELTSLAALLQRYQDAHQGYILLLFCSAYLYKQTFAIPGSVFLNVLAGALFGPWSVPLVCFLSAIGATCCYFISYSFGYKYIQYYFPHKLQYLQEKVHENSDSLFFFLLFSRLFPMTPNWFLNIAAPIIDIPVSQFFFSVLIGLIPYNLVCVQTGSILSEIKSMDRIFSTWTLCKLVIIAIGALVPGIVAKRYHLNIKEKVKTS